METNKILSILKNLEDRDEFTIYKLAKDIGKSTEETRDILGDLSKQGLVELDEYDEEIGEDIKTVLMNVFLTSRGKEKIK